MGKQMSKVPDSERHALTLEQLQRHLESLGLAARRLDTGDRPPGQVLLVQLPKDRHRREHAAALAFIPLSPQQIPHSALLQITIDLPHVSAPADPTALDRVLGQLNPRMALGQFARGASGRLMCRHVLCLANDRPPDPGVLEDALGLLLFALDAFLPLLERVALGAMSARDAIDALSVKA